MCCSSHYTPIDALLSFLPTASFFFQSTNWDVWSQILARRIGERVAHGLCITELIEPSEGWGEGFPTSIA